MDLVDMIKFNHEQLQQEAIVLLEEIQSNIDLQEYSRAINNIWYLSGAVSKCALKKKIYENEQKQKEKSSKNLKTIHF